MDDQSIARVRLNPDNTKSVQRVEAHLVEVAQLAATFAGRIGLGRIGELLGILHDLGKRSIAFWRYIGSAKGLIDPDTDEYVDAKMQKGKIDHSAAGGQLVYESLRASGDDGWLAGEVLALSLVSHHSGLIDMLTPGGEDNFALRMAKADSQTHLREALASLDSEVRDRIEGLLHDSTLIKMLADKAGAIRDLEKTEALRCFQEGMLVKFLHSTLLDADRLNSAEFADPEKERARPTAPFARWAELLDRLDCYLARFPEGNMVDRVRRKISSAALDAGGRGQGAFTLTVPTGGGKTLASLRFALRHAIVHGLERIFYIVPFNTIIEQNADQLRLVLEEGYPDDAGKLILEHHSNLLPDLDSDFNKLFSENWDAPIVFTTNVQALEAMFGPKTRGPRRFHRMAKAVLIFDEAQVIPIKCVHIFNNALNFLVAHCGSTAILCTATQPLLDQVDEKKGVVRLHAEQPEIMPEARELFVELARVDVSYLRHEGGWSNVDVAEKAAQELLDSGSVLVVVNTKACARGIFESLKLQAGPEAAVFHLSTSMCPAHRKAALARIKERLADKRPVACVSTQLIEAGVDVDFGSVIRALAGLDSIAQAAGRCNRHGFLSRGRVSIVELAEEHIASLRDIAHGKACARRILDDFTDDPAPFANDPIGLEAMRCYYEYYFTQRAGDMAYSVDVGRKETLLNLLSENGRAGGTGGMGSGAVGEYWRKNDHHSPALHLRQSFKSAAEEFKAIDAPTEGVLVPWGRGEELMALLQTEEPLGVKRGLLREAQGYSVSLRQTALEAFQKQGLLHVIPEIGVSCLVDNRYYSDEFGLSNMPQGLMKMLEA